MPEASALDHVGRRRITVGSPRMAVASQAIRTGPDFPILLSANLAMVAAAALIGHIGTVSIALLACVIPLAIAVARRPQRALLALVALTPLNGLLIVIPHPWVMNGWKEALLIFAVLCSFLRPAATEGVRKPRLPGWAPAAIALLALSAASGLVVGGVQALVGLKVGYFYVLAAVVAWRCPLDARERDRMVTILMVVGTVSAVYGLAQQVLGPERLNAMGYPYNDTIRFTGSFLRSFSTFNQPFGFGFFMMVVLLVGLPQALTEPQRRRNRIFLYLMPLLVLGMLSTFVRGAWLGTAVGVAYLGAHRYRVLLLLVPLALLSLAFLPAEVASSALSPTSTKERTSSWQQNIGQVLVHPLGTGVGSSGAAAEKSAAPGTETYQPDNFYFKMLLELGLLGLWMLLLLLAAAFADTRAAARRLPGRDGALASGVSAMVVAAGAACLVATYFEIFPMDLLFWLLIAVVTRCDRASA